MLGSACQLVGLSASQHSIWISNNKSVTNDNWKKTGANILQTYSSEKRLVWQSLQFIMHSRIVSRLMFVYAWCLEVEGCETQNIVKLSYPCSVLIINLVTRAVLIINFVNLYIDYWPSCTNWFFCHCRVTNSIRVTFHKTSYGRVPSKGKTILKSNNKTFCKLVYSSKSCWKWWLCIWF